MLTECVDCPPPSLLRPFDPAPFMPRVECGNWPGWMIWGWSVPSIGLCLFYWAIAMLVVLLYRRTKPHHRGTGLPLNRLPWIAAFFVGCGGEHLMNLLAFFWPAYVAFIVWDWYTLVVSGVGVYGVYDVVRWSFNKVNQLESGLHHAVEDKDAAQTDAALAREQAAAADDRLVKKFQADFAQNERRAQELNAIGQDLSALLDKQFTEEAYQALRKRLHAVRGTLT